MKVYLDDVRRPYDETWTLVKTPKECIDLIKNNKVFCISLDHDLGDDDRIGTGMDVLDWIEMVVETDKVDELLPHGFPFIKVHTANPVARKRMIDLSNKLNRKAVLKGLMN